jgi:RecA/RadA recombinase
MSDKDILKVLDTIKNEDADVLADNSLSIVSDWIDTGSMALNAIVSGSLYKGIPVGRITGLVGPSGCGKTLIMNKIMAHAQPKGFYPVIWDSEAAVDAQAAENVGCDPSQMKYCPVETIEEARNQITGFLDNVIASPSLHGKFIIGLDSLGNLASQKELDDAKAGKSATDMGLRAKAIKSMMRTITYKCAKAGVPMIFTNHTYDDPGAMYPSTVKSQSGGKGPIYLASLLIQLAVNENKNKDADDEAIKISRNVTAGTIKGVKMTAMTVKNRFVPPFLETELELNFKTGLKKYAGILEMAKAYDIIIATGPTHQLSDGTKLGYFKDWSKDPAIWKDKILPHLEKTINAEFADSNESVDALEEEIENLTEEAVDA